MYFYYISRKILFCFANSLLLINYTRKLQTKYQAYNYKYAKRLVPFSRILFNY